MNATTTRNRQDRIPRNLIPVLLVGLLSLPAGAARAQQGEQGTQMITGMTAAEAIQASSFTRDDADRVMTLEESVSAGLGQSFSIFQLKQQYLQTAYSLESARRQLRTNIQLNSTLPGINQSINPQLISTGGGGQELVFIRDSSAFVYTGVDIIQPLITNGRIVLSSSMVGYDASRDLPSTVVKNRSVQPSIGVQFNQPLFQYNDVKGTLKTASLNVESLKLSYTEEELRLINQASQQFYNLYAQQSALELAVQRFQQSDRNYQSGLRREQAGLIPQVEVLRLQVTRANDMDAMLNARNQLEQQQFAFNRLLGLPLQQRVYVEADLEYRPIQVDLDRALELAMANRSDIRRAEIALETRNLDLARTVSQGRPNLQLNASYDITGNSSLTALPGDDWSKHLSESLNPDNRSPNTNVSLTLSIPIFDWGRNASNVQRQLSQIRVQQEQVEEVRKNLIRTVTDRVRAVESAMRRLEIQIQNVQVAQTSYDFTQRKFDRGEITTTELAQALDQLSQTQTNRLNAQIAYELAKADLKEITLWDWETNQPATQRTTPPEPFQINP